MQREFQHTLYLTTLVTLILLLVSVLLWDTKDTSNTVRGTGNHNYLNRKVRQESHCSIQKSHFRSNTE
jgi:hypothetical protein